MNHSERSRDRMISHIQAKSSPWPLSLKDRVSPSETQGEIVDGEQAFYCPMYIFQSMALPPCGGFVKSKVYCHFNASFLFGSPHHTAPSRQYPHKSADSYRSRRLRQLLGDPLPGEAGVLVRDLDAVAA